MMVAVLLMPQISVSHLEEEVVAEELMGPQQQVEVAVLQQPAELRGLDPMGHLRE